MTQPITYDQIMKLRSELNEAERLYLESNDWVEYQRGWWNRSNSDKLWKTNDAVEITYSKKWKSIL